VWVSSGLSKLCGQDPERLSGFDGNSQLGFSTKTTKHGGGSLLPQTRSHQLHAEPDFGEVDRREIYGFLPSDGVNIGRRELHVQRRSTGWYRSTNPRISQLRHAPPPTLPIGGDSRRQCLGGLVVKRAIQVRKYAEGILTWRFGNQPSDVPLISDEHDLFLVAFESVENGTEVARYVGHGQRLHTIRLSD
jgi:hypothetical protein